MTISMNKQVQVSVEDLLDTLNNVQEEAAKPSTGIASRPTKETDKDGGVLSFFRDMFANSQAKAAEAREAIQPEMYRLAKESAYEVSEARQMAGITRSLTEGGGEIGRKPLPEGTTLRPVAKPPMTSMRDVTDTDEGKLNNEQPLRDLASAVANEQISSEELEPVATDEADEVVNTLVEQLTSARIAAGGATEESAPVTAETETTGGLMSKPLADTEKAGRMFGSEGSTEEFASRFVDLMGEAEGTEDHTASEGQFTYAYGILPATANALGVDPDDFETRREFANAVYGKMYENAKESYADVFDGMNLRDREAVMSLYINLGRLPSGVEEALNSREKDIEGAADSLKSVVHYTVKKGANKGTKYASKGLSKRRASEYNMLMRGREGFSEVAQVSVEGSKAEPVFVWKDAGGNEVKRFASSRALSPDNSMKDIDV